MQKKKVLKKGPKKELKPTKASPSKSSSTNNIKNAKTTSNKKNLKVTPKLPEKKVLASSKKGTAKKSLKKKVLKKPITKPNLGSIAKMAKETEASKKIPSKQKTVSNSHSKKMLQPEQFSISIIEPGSKKNKTLRTKKFPQTPAQKPFGFPDEAPSLPSEYGIDKFVIMPKDPEYIFAYWEITPALWKKKVQEKNSAENYREAVKIDWETNDLFETNFVFVPVEFSARKWYFKMPEQNKNYRLELGWLGANGHFITLLNSNASVTPESWETTRNHLAQNPVLAYITQSLPHLGSSEFKQNTTQLAYIPNWNMNSETFSSSSWAKKSQTDSTKVDKGVQLEVKGKVAPGTHVNIGNQEVETDAKGNFKVVFPATKNVLNLELSSNNTSKSFRYEFKELILF